MPQQRPHERALPRTRILARGSVARRRALFGESGPIRYARRTACLPDAREPGDHGNASPSGAVRLHSQYAMSDSDSTTGRGLSVQQLLCAVETELIPRLLCAHAREVSEGDSPARRARPLSGSWATEEEVGRFATLCLADDDVTLAEHVCSLVGQGVGLDAVYLHLLAPAARELGDRWSEDDVSFVDVQIGLSRLHALVRNCAPIGSHHDVASPHSVLLSTVPGDQHTFGVTLVADFFRRFGWQSSNLCGLSDDFLLERIASQHYDAMGLSVNNITSLAVLERLLPRMLRASVNQEIIVLVGGDIAFEERTRVEALGVDMLASDAHAAVLETERLVAIVRGIGRSAVTAGHAAPDDVRGSAEGRSVAMAE